MRASAAKMPTPAAQPATATAICCNARVVLVSLRIPVTVMARKMTYVCGNEQASCVRTWSCAEMDRLLSMSYGLAGGHCENRQERLLDAMGLGGRGLLDRVRPCDRRA